VGFAEHGAPDYNSKTAAGCEATGEPCFLLRAQDRHAPAQVHNWASMVSDPQMAGEGHRIGDAMGAWQREHGAKEPD
jgi:hypothetical protein